MYNSGCNSCGNTYGRSNNFSWIIWIIVILFVIGLFDCDRDNGSDCDRDSSYNRNNGCGCGCN